ncbi:MAG TPA: biotin--[acetyl-CoA-carboxylase] ligase [Thermoleophilaceae bacterium]|nr:biotin--[acetyl-CoA-carboxylase] ligase [Thermoleophilaceae bacterium]
MIGRPRVHHRVTDSTNERARALATAGAPHGTLVTADEQTAGRGRQGRAWVAPPRASLLLSLVLHDPSEALPLAAAVAVCEALPVEAAIKWPNDIWIDREKVAGILVEGRPQEGWAVLGIGVNVDAAPPLEHVTSLAHKGVGLTVAALLDRLLLALDGWLFRPLPEILAAWRYRDALLGETVRWENGSGEAVGIDDRGALLVDTASGRVALDAGEVHLLR